MFSDTSSRGVSGQDSQWPAKEETVESLAKAGPSHKATQGGAG